MSTSDIFLGFGITVALAVGCQIIAAKFRLPAIVLLLPVGFIAGHFITEVNPEKTLGQAFSPLVALGVAIILFDGGLDLNFSELEGHSQRVLRRLLILGVIITCSGATLLAWLLLDMSGWAALMLGAIVIVSGPTVVSPLLEAARPGRRVSRILGWEGVMIDPIGAIIGAVLFQGVVQHVQLWHGTELLAFLRSIGAGVVGGVIGTAVLWLLLSKLRLSGVLATQAIVATVIGTAAFCDAARDDTGLIAAIIMGVALANLPGVDLPEDRRFFKTVVQMVIGLLFISISATVTTTSVRSVLGATLAVIAGLVLVVRPLVAIAATLRSPLSVRERAFVGWMDPRGIVAASTAATFGPPLASAGIAGADKLLPATFLIIVGTVTTYGLTAAPLAGLLGLSNATEPTGEIPPKLPAELEVDDAEPGEDHEEP